MAGRRQHTAMPRWVKVFGITLAVLVLLIVAMMFIVGGEHGPGRHTSSGAELKVPAVSEGGRG